MYVCVHALCLYYPKYDNELILQPKKKIKNLLGIMSLAEERSLAIVLVFKEL